MKKALSNSFGLARQKTQERMGNAVITQDPEVDTQTQGLQSTKKQYDAIAKAADDSIRRAKKLSESWTVLAQALQSPFQGHNLASAGGWSDPTIAKQAAQLAESGAKLALLLQDYCTAAEAVCLGPSRDFLDGPIARAVESRRYYEQRRQKLDMRRNKNIDERSSDMVTALAKYDNSKRRFIENVKSVRSKTNQIMVRQVTLHTAAQAKIFSAASQYVQQLGTLASDVCQLYNFRLQLPGTADQEARLKKAGLKTSLPPASNQMGARQATDTKGRQQAPRPIATHEKQTPGSIQSYNALPAPEPIDDAIESGDSVHNMGARQGPRGMEPAQNYGAIDDRPYKERADAPDYGRRHAYGAEGYERPAAVPLNPRPPSHPQDEPSYHHGQRPDRTYPSNTTSDVTPHYSHQSSISQGHYQGHAPPPRRDDAASYGGPPVHGPTGGAYGSERYDRDRYGYPEQKRHDNVQFSGHQDRGAAYMEPPPRYMQGNQDLPHERYHQAGQSQYGSRPQMQYQESYDQQDPYGQQDGDDQYSKTYYQGGGPPPLPNPHGRQPMPPQYDQPPVHQRQPPSMYSQHNAGYERPPSHIQQQDPMMGDLLSMSPHNERYTDNTQAYGVTELSQGMASSQSRDQPPPIYSAPPQATVQRKPRGPSSAADWRNPFA